MWNPKTKSNIKKSWKQSEKPKDIEKNTKQNAIPCDLVIQETRNVRKLKHEVEKKSQNSQSQLARAKIQADVHVLSRADNLSALGRNSQFQQKICQYLDYLREIIEDPPEIEDTNDLRKRQKRATEFSNRFARNHLYQIGRIVRAT